MSIILALILTFTNAHTAYAAVAIASCESGDTVTFGSFMWTARNDRTHDGGAFQFNDVTWDWIVGTGQGNTASPLVQTKAFIVLFDYGNGISHWSSSKPCWSKWLDDTGQPINQKHYDEFVSTYLKQQKEQRGAKR